MSFDQDGEAYKFRKKCVLNAKLAKFQEPRTTRTAGDAFNLTSIAIDAEHILHNSTSPSIRTAYVDPGHTLQNEEDEVKFLAQGLESNRKGSLYIPERQWKCCGRKREAA